MDIPNTEIVRAEDFDRPAVESSGMVETAKTRAAAEIQSAMVIAKRFPRDEFAAFEKIMKACKRKTLAESASYSYRRGGQMVTGPSIRLAETMARAWGNIEAGVTEVEQRDGESIMLAYAWDLETNTRISRTFAVKHERHTKEGVKDLTDPRDIYELTANQGSRRLRACILQLMPADIVEAAEAQCAKTLTEDQTESLADRVRKMVAWLGERNVDVARIEARLGHNLAAVTEQEFVTLRKVANAIKDGVTDPLAEFPPVGKEAPKGNAGTKAALGIGSAEGGAGK